jgi:hypothetical protein
MLQEIQRATTALAAGRAHGEKIVFGSWALGSVSDQDYGNPGDIHESLLLIGERQAGGPLRLARGAGSLTARGCSYLDSADLDGDGIDDVVLQCDAVEGNSDYAFLQRVDGVWRTE